MTLLSKSTDSSVIKAHRQCATPPLSVCLRASTRDAHEPEGGWVLCYCISHLPKWLWQTLASSGLAKELWSALRATALIFAALVFVAWDPRALLVLEPRAAAVENALIGCLELELREIRR